jgi:FixJ family two-component response regulator
MRSLLLQSTPAIGSAHEARSAKAPGRVQGAVARTARSKRAKAPEVLLVDDDPATLGSLGRLLRSAGLRVRMFDRPSTLLNEELPSERTCIILDVNLPEMNGITLHEVLHAAGRALPTIFITGLTDAGTHRQLEKADPVAILYKPVHQRVLFEAIRIGLRATAPAA